MKVLVTNNTLRDLGGSETAAYALIDELNKRKDIQVFGFSPNIGYIGDLLKNKGIVISNNISIVDKYDLILASHLSTIEYVRNLSGFKIQTCHGVFMPIEQPARGMNKYVAISEEVMNHLSSLGYDSTIIHNGVDCERFMPKNKINENVRTILSLAQSDELNRIIKKVCDKMGIKLFTLNKFINPIFNVEDHINQSDLVISLGRGAFESMACGRNVIVLDKRPYVNRPPIGDGLITKDNIDNILKNNCSGRYSNKIYTEVEIENEIKKYDYKLGDFCREYALENFNIVKQVDKYLSLLYS